ncbi:pilus assembly protein [bacterium]|nr:pilus assembly protein [bacterium]
MSLIEQLMVVSLVGLLAAIPIVTGGSDRDQLQLDASARRLQSGLDRGRSIARREQRACAMSLSKEGFMAPDEGSLPGSLPACPGIAMALQEEFEQGPIVLDTNLPSVLRFTSNGLLLDGGIAVLSHQRLAKARCLVVSLPLGVSRIGSYQGPLPSEGGRLLSSRCLPDVSSS